MTDTTDTLEPIQSFAIDAPTKQDYQFQHFQDIKHQDPEYAEWGGKERPKDKVIIRDQWNAPSCTCFSQWVITNGLNVLEDAALWESRPQINPKIWWDEYCNINNNPFTNGTSIQDMALFFKKQWLIEWFVSINNLETNIVQKMKQAIDNGNFLCTGSSNGDWTATAKTGVYTLRTDGRFVWHWRCIPYYTEECFWWLTSWWPKRGIYWWYFKVPFDMVTNLYSKLAIIDKDDSFYFHKMEDMIKVQQMETLAKELYGRGNQAVKDYFQKIQLSANLDKLYK